MQTPMDTTTATEWVSVAEAAVRLAVDPKTIQRRLVAGHRRHLASRPGPRGVEVEVPAKTSTAEVATALTVAAEREIQMAGTLVASVERERRTMKTVALTSAGMAVAALVALAALWNAYADQGAALVIAKAGASRMERVEREASMTATALTAAQASARYWQGVAERERERREADGQLSYILRPELLARD